MNAPPALHSTARLVTTHRIAPLHDSPPHDTPPIKDKMTVKELREETKAVRVLLIATPIGEVVTYQQLTAIMGKDAQTAGRSYIYSAMRAAARAGQEWDCIPHVGYIHLEHKVRPALAEKYTRKARRAAHRANRVIGNTNTADMTPYDKANAAATSLRAELIRDLTSKRAKGKTTQLVLANNRLPTKNEILAAVLGT